MDKSLFLDLRLERAAAAVRAVAISAIPALSEHAATIDEAREVLAEQVAEIARLTALVRTLAAELREFEWIPNPWSGNKYSCPRCHAPAPIHGGDGHKPDWTLAAALALAEGAAPC